MPCPRPAKYYVYFMPDSFGPRNGIIPSLPYTLHIRRPRSVLRIPSSVLGSATVTFQQMTHHVSPSPSSIDFQYLAESFLALSSKEEKNLEKISRQNDPPGNETDLQGSVHA